LYISFLFLILSQAGYSSLGAQTIHFGKDFVAPREKLIQGKEFGSVTWDQGDLYPEGIVDVGTAWWFHWNPSQSSHAFGSCMSPMLRIA
jgi:hypothetical protein